MLQQITTRFSGLKQHNLLSYTVLEVESLNCILQAPNQMCLQSYVPLQPRGENLILAFPVF